MVHKSKTFKIHVSFVWCSHLSLTLSLCFQTTQSERPQNRRRAPIVIQKVVIFTTFFDWCSACFSHVWCSCDLFRILGRRMGHRKRPEQHPRAKSTPHLSGSGAARLDHPQRARSETMCAHSAVFSSTAFFEVIRLLAVVLLALFLAPAWPIVFLAFGFSRGQEKKVNDCLVGAFVRFCTSVCVLLRVCVWSSHLAHNVMCPFSVRS